MWIGDVLIRNSATGTDSYEQNRNLVLSEGTRADSIPNLEIETGDREKEKERVDEMCRKLLANEMIEEYLVLPEEESAKGAKK